MPGTKFAAGLSELFFAVNGDLLYQEISFIWVVTVENKTKLAERHQNAP